MKRKIYLELLTASALAIVLTLMFSLVVFYGLFKEQVVKDLKVDALILRNVQTWEELEAIATDSGVQGGDSLRITIVGKGGNVLYDSDADEAAMENHADRPEIQEAFASGHGSGTRHSETIAEDLFYYAVQLENGDVLRVSKKADSFWAVFQNMLPFVMGVCVILFILCIGLSGYFTQSLVQPIETMAEKLSEPGISVPYAELAPFITKIRQQHEDILSSAKMRQEFTANVSHELKTPLTAISGYAELIEHGMADREMAVRFSGEIRKSAERLLNLINDIIQLSKLDGEHLILEYTEFDLYDLAEECIDMLMLNAQKQNVTMELCGTSSMIRADRQLVEELVYNLCDNAIRYNQQDGMVTVTVKHREADTLLSVKDTGIGIPKEHQERIFERFYRVDKGRSRSVGGTGLGLAIVKHIVSQHNAMISLESTEGKGTEICVKFPDVI